MSERRGSIEPLEQGLAKALAITRGWPDSTLVVRGDSHTVARLEKDRARGAHRAYRPPLIGWSVQSKPFTDRYWLCMPLISRTVRITTLGEIRKAGGDLAKTPGGHEHGTVVGIDAGTFNDILGAPERNPYFRKP